MTTLYPVLVPLSVINLEELKKSEYNDHEDMVYRFQLTYEWIIDIIDIKYTPTTSTRNTLPLGIYKIGDFILMWSLYFLMR